MEEFWKIVLSIVIVIIVAGYAYLKFMFSFWWRKGFPYIQPIIPIGNMLSTVTKKSSFSLNVYEHYKTSDEPFTGLYLFTSPTLLIRDPDLVRKVLITDFQSFYDRGVYCNPEVDSMSENLFRLPGEKWKQLRTKLTPTFTSGKLKAMFPIILEIGQQFQDHMTVQAEKNAVVEMKEMSLRYTIDVISNIIFGYELDSIKDPDNEFVYISKRVNSFTPYENLMDALMFLCPRILNTFKINPTPKFLREFVMRIVKETIEYREKNDVQRNDFMQLLLQLRNTGMVKADGDMSFESSGKKLMTMELLASQVQLFLTVGYETTAATISFALHELAHYPDVTQKAVTEIDEVLSRHNGAITYESMKEMKYLDLILQEIMRKYPALPILNRVTTKDYQLPNTHLKLEKGTPVILSVMGLHRDEKYFPNANGFEPERFEKEIKRYDDRVYLPFGDGPRICIGYRMGRLLVKCSLIYLLAKFKFESLEGKDLEFDERVVGLIPKSGINMRVSLRN